MFFKVNQEKFNSAEQNLGNNGKALLGCKFYLLDSNGKILVEDGYKENSLFPMASTKKLAIALTVLRRVFEERSLSLNTVISIANHDFSPGRPTNSLDRFFFMPWDITEQATVDELITWMLTESDNSSTDVLLSLAGGIDVVNQLMKDLGLVDHQLTWSSKTLLANYYKTPTNKSFANICGILSEFVTAFSLRPTEESMVQSGMDACSPQMMAGLLKCMIHEIERNTWIGQSARVVFAKMEKCLTGNTTIKAGAQDFLSLAKSFGSKQGGIGGIRNDSAFLNFQDGKWIILTIHTCLSELSLAERDAVIASLGKSILSEYCDTAETDALVFQ